MRILVTGGAGFIGSHVADSLAADGHDVVVLDALVPQAHRSATVPRWSDGHEFIVGDVRDQAAVEAALRGVDAVCHQAAAVGHGIDPADAPMYASYNDYGTAVLLAAMYRAGIGRLVLASSMVVYGEGRYACDEHGVVTPDPRSPQAIAAGKFESACPRCGRLLGWRLVPEDAMLSPRSTYAATKVAQEHLAAAWARQTGGSVWAMRYHNVYGSRMPRDTPYAGVASMFRSALARGEAPRVFEDGRQTRDFVHVTDVARANLLALALPTPGFTAVNVCSGEPRTLSDFAGVLATAMRGPEPVVVGGARAGDVRHIVASPALAAEQLGFRARVAFERGVKDFAGEEQRTAAA